MSNEAPQPPLSREDRRRLAREARRTVRLLAEALEEAGEDPSAATDAAALLDRVQAAVQPLRAAAGALSGEGTLTAGPPALLQVTATRSTFWNVEAPVASGTGAATLTVTATGSGHSVPSGSAPPDTFQVTAEDVPWILWQVLLRLDDMANPTKPGVTVGQVYDRLMPLLGILIALLPYLT
jgi:hypothetical protein